MTTASPSWVGSAPTPTAGRSSRSATRAEAVSSFTSRTTDRSPGERVTPPCGPTPLPSKMNPLQPPFNLVQVPCASSSMVSREAINSSDARVPNNNEQIKQILDLLGLCPILSVPSALAVLVRRLKCRLNKLFSSQVRDIGRHLFLLEWDLVLVLEVFTEARITLRTTTIRISANGWRYTFFGSNGDDVLIEITFAPGQPTTYKITPGASNDDGTGNSNYNSY